MTAFIRVVLYSRKSSKEQSNVKLNVINWHLLAILWEMAVKTFV